MTVLRKLRERRFVAAQRAEPAQPARVVCPPAPPGFSYIVVNGEYRLVSRPGAPGGGPVGSPPNCRVIPIYVGEAPPNPTDPTGSSGGAIYRYITICNGGGTVGEFGG